MGDALFSILLDRTHLLFRLVPELKSLSDDLVEIQDGFCDTTSLAVKDQLVKNWNDVCDDIQYIAISQQAVFRNQHDGHRDVLLRHSDRTVQA